MILRLGTREVDLGFRAPPRLQAYVAPPVLTRELVPGLAAELDVALISIDPTWVIVPAGS